VKFVKTSFLLDEQFTRTPPTHDHSLSTVWLQNSSTNKS